VNVVLSIEAVRPPLAGIGRYVWELATRLPQQTEIDSLRFLSDGLWRELPRLEANSEQAATSLNFSSKLRHQLGRNPVISKLYGKLMPVLATRQLNQVQNGVFHGPNFFVPETDLASVVTIHDLSAYSYDHWHPATRITRMRQVLPQAVQRANLILTDSHATRLEVIREFGLNAEQVQAIHLGVDPVYHPRAQPEVAAILAQFGLAYEGFSLFVSTIEPRKNLLNLLQAYRQLPIVLRQRWPLVIIGSEGWNSQPIHDEITRAVGEEWVKYLGFVEQRFLPMLYAACRLFVYPSLYEGFGLPVAEAMASGVPVLTSDCSSMPEVAAGCALLVPPQDVDQISLGLQRGLEDEAWRASAKQAGLQRAAELSWDTCVQQTTRAYQNALALQQGVSL
jgi:alpha-1,3-rhamnosyl/mannosyltransferase